ncbi:MAG: pyridoxamine 5'-phosphate oxidase family protein [Candidatus Hydrogenedentes bacterium]|nr:pyridoxamine 5'-phosphate oxidase family protein [Candidatus Hydrogenedentota bacterium]
MVHAIGAGLEPHQVTEQAARARLEKHWPQVRPFARAVSRSSIAYSIASMGEDGRPQLTPVGSLRFHADYRASYFELFALGLGRNLDRDPNVCIMGVNSSRWYWFRALFQGRAAHVPGYRFAGVAGPRRDATEEEIAWWQRRLKPLRRLRGYDMLWADESLRHVRDIAITDIIPVHLGRLTSHLR